MYQCHSPHNDQNLWRLCIESQESGNSVSSEPSVIQPNPSDCTKGRNCVGYQLVFFLCFTLYSELSCDCCMVWFLVFVIKKILCRMESGLLSHIPLKNGWL